MANRIGKSGTLGTAGDDRRKPDIMAASLAKREELYHDDLAAAGEGFLLDVNLQGTPEEEDRKLRTRTDAPRCWLMRNR
jgi:hypothetical protein